MTLQVSGFFVDADWLFENLNNENLVVLDATIPKVGAPKDLKKDNYKIKNARFFDIKNRFSSAEAKFPNTVLSAEKFKESAQKIGINENCCIVIYDNHGVYSSPRAFWNFHLMGFKNVAILDGGFPLWKAKKYPIEKEASQTFDKANFKVNFQSNKIASKKNILNAINDNETMIIDARSKGRFFGTEPEPRKEVKSGHIPNSVSLPYTELFNGNELKSIETIKSIFSEINPNNKQMIFTCGSGITASVLYFFATCCGYKNCSVYDGSWTEWGSSNYLPITL